ncbi:MAG: hypothetical protein ABI140_13545 [Jatrophihabitantaceae bacterium]
MSEQFQPAPFDRAEPIDLGFNGRSGGAQLIFSGPIKPGSEAALRRYLLTRALGRSVIQAVQWSGISILLIAALCWLGGLKVLGILIGLVAIAMLVLRAMLAGIERRLTGSVQLGEVEPRVAKLVSRTGRSLRRELRRVGLPGTPWAPLQIALRLIRPLRRAQTARSLSQINLDQVVPSSQLDELHLLLQAHR